MEYDLGNGNCADLDLFIGESGSIDIQARNFEGNRVLNRSSVRRVSAKG
ncbi:MULTISPECIES: hypothetical protein [unclassified Streptomyces]